MYYFALIANKAVPNEVVFLHEIIGILIIRSLIALHWGFFEPPPVVTILFGSEPVSSYSFSQPFNSILANPSNNACKKSESLTGLGLRIGSKKGLLTGNLSPLLLSGKRFREVFFDGFICLLSSFISKSEKNWDKIPQPAFDAPPHIQLSLTRWVVIPFSLIGVLLIF